MKSTLIVGIGASLLTAGIAKAQQRQDITPRTPNVLFIYADDLGYGDLECYDGTQVKTPNINRLAASPTLTRPPLPVRPPDIPC